MSHEPWTEAAAAFALDSLDAADREAFESHLARCADCRAAVQEFRDVAGLLAWAPPAEPAPPTLRARVETLVRADADGRDARSKRPRPAPFAALPWLAAAAGLAVAVAGGLMARRAATDADALDARMAALDARLSAQDSLLLNLTGPEVHVVSLAAGTDKPVARVFWNHTRDRFIVTAFALPPVPDGSTYQLWAIARGRDPVSMGTFTTDADGRASLILPVGDDIDALGFIDFCAVTVEPAGGSPRPTSSPLFQGTWRHTD